jgi:N-acetylglucosaminyl-diphospho-decaprenol L-rhamnosyltransferase
MSLDIIIVNWNSGPFLLKCISSIYETTSGIDFKIIIVDNHSTDGSTDKIPVKNMELLIKSESNLGFAKACNLAVSRSDSELLLFLNPDTKVGLSTLESAVSFLSTTPTAGIVGVRQESEKGELIPSCSRFLRLKYMLNDVLGFSKLFPHMMKPATIMTDWSHDQLSVVDQVMGSFMMIRRSDFIRLGGFDEQFFMYYEDMDLAKRILTLDKKSYYINEIKIIHKGCSSSDSVKDKRLFYSLSSRIKYARKYLGWRESFLITFLTIFPESFTRLLYSLLIKGSINDANNTIKGYLLFTGWLLKGR